MEMKNKSTETYNTSTGISDGKTGIRTSQVVREADSNLSDLYQELLNVVRAKRSNIMTSIELSNVPAGRKCKTRKNPDIGDYDSSESGTNTAGYSETDAILQKGFITADGLSELMTAFHDSGEGEAILFEVPLVPYSSGNNESQSLERISISKEV